MSDVFSKQKRSAIMSANRGRGTKSTERRLQAQLVSAGISGWRINAKDVLGKPDFVFDKEHLAIFVDGCFWHGCKSCRTIPVTHREFWKKKIRGNQRRDIAIARMLRKQGWHVVHIWEHDLRRSPKRSLNRIKKKL